MLFTRTDYLQLLMLRSPSSAQTSVYKRVALRQQISSLLCSATNYLMGLSSVPFKPFLAATFVAMAIWGPLYASIGAASRECCRAVGMWEPSSQACVHCLDCQMSGCQRPHNLGRVSLSNFLLLPEPFQAEGLPASNKEVKSAAWGSFLVCC